LKRLNCRKKEIAEWKKKTVKKEIPESKEIVGGEELLIGGKLMLEGGNCWKTENYLKEKMIGSKATARRKEIT
jgi:hypothetical protein